MVWIWLGFIALILLLLALDLGVFHRKAHVVSAKEALGWTGVWIVLALGFAVFVYHGYEEHWLGLGSAPDPIDRLSGPLVGEGGDGATAVAKYLTGYIVEKSLSIDNVFAIAMVFGFFAVPTLYQHRVLFWGILGALLLRGLMIAAGAHVVARFGWVLYVFGAFLILTAIRMLLPSHGGPDPGRNPLVRLVRRLFPVTDRFHGDHFTVRAGSSRSREPEVPGGRVAPDRAVAGERRGRLMLTPLALALVVVEATDVLFAVDSIPAIFAITADPFLVFTSNVFAILGLRSLYFVLATAIETFRHLKVSLAVVLAVVGIKMLAHGPLRAWLGPAFNFYVLGLILAILGAGVVASIVGGRRAPRAAPPLAQRIQPRQR
jgi:tellurite resistance protein TerC